MGHCPTSNVGHSPTRIWDTIECRHLTLENAKLYISCFLPCPTRIVELAYYFKWAFQDKWTRHPYPVAIINAWAMISVIYINSRIFNFYGDIFKTKQPHIADILLCTHPSPNYYYYYFNVHKKRDQQNSTQ